MALPLLHLVAFVLDAYALYYDQRYVNVKIVEGIDGYPFNNRVLFLTMWTLFLQTVYMGIAFLNDLIGTNEASPKKPPVIRKIKDALFSLAYPLALYVTLAFWGIYFVDRELIFPARLTNVFPSWLNHVMHTLVTVFINIEMFTSNIKYPSFKVNFFLAQTTMLAYVVWILVVYNQSGAWVYPILGYLGWPARIFFIATSLVIANILNEFGKMLNRKLSTPKSKRK